MRLVIDRIRTCIADSQVQSQNKTETCSPTFICLLNHFEELGVLPFADLVAAKRLG